MKQYRAPFSIFRWFNVRYFDKHIVWRNDITRYQGRSRGEVASIFNNAHAENYFCSRQYSSGFLGVNRIAISSNDIDSGRVVEFSPKCSDFHQLDNSSHRGETVDYKQNVGHFQHLSSLESHYVADNWSFPRNLDQHTTESIGTNLLDTGYSNGGNTTVSQQINNLWTPNTASCQQSLGNLYKGNRVACHADGYQQERIGAIASNAYHQANVGAALENSSGHYNFYSAPQQQNFNGSHSPKVLPQPQMGAVSDGISTENDEFDDDKNIEGTLEELDTFCKEWDLERAVKSMRKLSKRGVYIDLPWYMALIDACGEAKALKEAQVVHQHLIRFIYPIEVSTFNRILEMYGKCGSMEDAYNTFSKMCERNLTSWDTMITWFAKNGLGEDAIGMFTKFKEVGLKPDGQMFFGLFDACGVLGDVTEGMLHFDSMSKIYGITPTMAHYASIINMFGSAGDLDGALEFIEKMPVEPNVDVWESLMNISRAQGNVDLGDRCAQIVEQLDPSRLSKELKAGLLPVKDSDFPKKKVKKANPFEHTKHEYRAGDRSHPENDKIYAVLRGIKESMKEAGYIPETRFVLHDIDQEGKEEAIMAHSERLACTYALITSAARMPLRIIKNLRVCGDCHNAFKIISMLVGREIIMRDAKRFHHFKDGKCSCNDYW